MHANVGPIAADATLVEIDGRFAAFIPGPADVVFLNETASAILRLCDGTRSLDQIAETIAAQYRVPVDDVSAEVEMAVASFGESGLFGSAAGMAEL